MGTTGKTGLLKEIVTIGRAFIESVLYDVFVPPPPYFGSSQPNLQDLENQYIQR
jgi:hypothetical protein